VEVQASVLDVFQSRQGEGICVGDHQIFIRFGGCNLSCNYCDTPDSIPAESGQKIGLSELLARVDRLSAGSPTVISLTGGEPLLHVRFLQTLIPALRTRGHRIYLETNGTLPQALEKIITQCDWVAMDVKPASAVARQVWEAHQWFLEAAGHKVFVKLVLTDQTEEAELDQTLALLAGVRRNIPLILQPATPSANSGAIPLARLACWWAKAVQQLSDVRILPQIHRLWGIP